MKIRNLTAKPIGFGSVVILPDQTGDSPKGYDRDHPTVKYYLSRKWIAEVGVARSGVAGNASTGLSVNVNAGGPGSPADDENNGENNNPGENENNSAGGSAPENKSIDRMNKDELQALAFERGVEFLETDTKAMLIEKIKAAQNGNE